MTTVREVALPLATICAPVPRVGDGICDRCHRPPNPPYTRCWSCEQVEGQVSRPCSLIVPISLYEVGLQLHYQLKHYKDDGGTKMAWEFLVKTAALLGYFLKQHGACISTAAGGGCPGSRRFLSGGSPALSAPVGSVRGANQVREDRRNRHGEGIRPRGRHDRRGVWESAATADSGGAR